MELIQNIIKPVARGVTQMVILGSKLKPLPPSDDYITFEDDTEPLTFEGDTEYIIFELIEN